MSTAHRRTKRIATGFRLQREKLNDVSCRLAVRSSAPCTMKSSPDSDDSIETNRWLCTLAGFAQKVPRGADGNNLGRNISQLRPPRPKRRLTTVSDSGVSSRRAKRRLKQRGWTSDGCGCTLRWFIVGPSLCILEYIPRRGDGGWKCGNWKKSTETRVMHAAIHGLV